jgi:ArsR family transcriptional regulator
MDTTLVKRLKALADETRLRLLGIMLARERCACDFSEGVGKDQSTVSRHLKVLEEAGIIVSRREGRFIIYRIKDQRTERLLKTLGVERLDGDCGGC